MATRKSHSLATLKVPEASPDEKVPNAKTGEALDRIYRGEDLVEYESLDALKAELS